MIKTTTILLFLIFFFSHIAQAQFTHADTLRGSITSERAWWDVIHYAIAVTPNYDQKSIKGKNEIRFKVLKRGTRMQIDLQQPLIIDSAFLGNKKRALAFQKDGNAWFFDLPALPVSSKQTISIYYHGNPREAVRPPWDGGWIFTRDSLHRPWMSVACEGLGASIWYPCKDHLSDEPDSGASLSITVADTLVAIGNGRLKGKKNNGDGTITFTWAVVNPINNYNIIPYIGKYVGWHEDYAGEKGKLDCDYWVLDYDLEKARSQFKQADSMLHCFEYWFGPYPFYEDGYKLVEAPHLGMEHQSAVAYGNRFGNGYKGTDLSGSGWGLKWDFIIVHESGHEWFGNNITCNDLADEWIHEGFTSYSETIYTECCCGREAANAYNRGIRKNIQNKTPIIGTYGVNDEPKGTDLYYKSSNMLQIIRQITGDSLFRQILRGLNKGFYHETVTTKQIEAFISAQAKKDLSNIFDQYLRTTQIPVLEYKQQAHTLFYRWADCVSGFNMPVKISFNGSRWITPETSWQKLEGDSDFSVDPNFYIRVKKIE